MTRWKSHIYIYTYYNNWNATSTHIWSNCAHSNAFIHFHHLLLGAKVNQCASVQQPTNLHLAPILIWEKNRKKACFSKKPCVDQSYSHFFNCIHLQNYMKLQVSAVNTYPVSPQSLPLALALLLVAPPGWLPLAWHDETWQVQGSTYGMTWNRRRANWSKWLPAVSSNIQYRFELQNKWNIELWKYHVVSASIQWFFHVS